MREIETKVSCLGYETGLAQGRSSGRVLRKTVCYKLAKVSEDCGKSENQ